MKFRRQNLVSYVGFLMAIGLILMCSLQVRAQFDSDFFNDTTNRANVVFNAGYVAGSNVMDVDFSNTFLYGGTIDREMKDRTYNRLKKANRLGLDFSMSMYVELPQDSLFGKKT